MNVLILEDDIRFAQIAERVAREAGCEPTVATSGLQAVTIAQQKPSVLTILILDLQLGRDDTAKRYNQLKKIYNKIRVIIYSVHDDLIEKYEKIIGNASLVGTVNKGEDNYEKKLKQLIIKESQKAILESPKISSADISKESRAIVTLGITMTVEKLIIPLIAIFSLGILAIVLPQPYLKFYCSMSTIVLSCEIGIIVYTNEIRRRKKNEH